MELHKTCNKLHYTRNIGIEKRTDLSADFRETFLWRAGLQDKNWKRCICLHHKQVFCNVFERKNEKCGGILKHHKRKAQGKKVVTLQTAQQLREKMVNVIPVSEYLV